MISACWLPAADLYVSASGSATAPYDSVATAVTTIQAGIDAAQSGDTIHIIPGLYRETLTVAGKALTLEGDGIAQTRLDANFAGSALAISANASVTLRGLTISGGLATLGGGISVVDAGLTASNVRITACRAGRGGGLYANNAIVSVNDSVIDGCDGYISESGAGKGGAIYVLYSPAGIPASFANCAIHGNRAVYGVVRAWASEAVFRQCQFFENRAESDIIELQSASHVDFVDCLIHSNQSLSRSCLAIYNESTSELAYCTITENESLGDESVVYVDVWSSFSCYNSALQRNSPDRLEVPSTAVFAGSALSTAPAGFRIISIAEAFSSSSEGAYFLANTAAAPTEFIGLGVSAGPSYVVAENVRRCFAAEETPAAVLNAGYGYPFGILGSLKVATLPEWTATGTGQPSRWYMLEESATMDFSAFSSRTIGPLTAVSSAVGIPEPTEAGLLLQRLRSSAPLGNSVAIQLEDNAQAAVVGVRVDLLAADGTEWYGAGVSDAQGQAIMQNVPDGSYTVLAGSVSADYVSTFLGNAGAVGAATTFDLRSGSRATGTITLAGGNRIEGHARIAGTATFLPDVAVVIYDSSDTPVKSAVTDAVGNYSIGGLPNGTYRALGQNSPAYSDSYYFNQADLASANGVAVSGSSTVNSVNLNLGAKLAITGEVTLPDQGNLFQITVVLYDASTFEERSFTFCDSLGQYTLYASPGTYIVSAGEGSSYVVTYSASLTVTSQPVTGQDFILSQGGTISGRITDSSAVPLSGIYVDIYETDGTTYVTSALTGADGTYTTPELGAGDYFVLAYGDPSYTNLWYPGTSNPTSATTVGVVAGQDTPNINIAISLAR